MTRTVFLSVKPQYAHGLLQGSKRAEVRRTFPLVEPGTTIVIYSTSPERAVIGTVRTLAATRLAPSEVWGRFRDLIEIDHAGLNEYLSGAAVSTVIEVEAPEPWNRAVSLDELRQRVGIDAPQSYRYIDDEQFRELRELSASTKHRPGS